MNPARAASFFRDKQFRQRQCNADALLLHVCSRVYILKPFPGRIARSCDSLQKGSKIIFPKGLYFLLHSLIFLKEMERTHHGTVSRKCTHFRQVCDHLFLGNLRADLFSKVLCYFFHLVWNGRIICAQIRVAFSRIYNHQAVILRAEIKINLLHNRRFRIFKIDRNQTADRARHLIEQTRRLVPELVFCIFSDVGVGDNIHLSLVKHRI